MLLEFGNDEVFRVFKDYRGLGETGETLVGMLTGDEVTFVARPRFNPEAGFSGRGRIGGKESVRMQLAVRGEHGYGESIDYRGEKVVAVWSYIPSFRWGMVVKQDADEAFRLIYHQRLATGVLFAVSMAAVVIVALLVARSISRPVRGRRGSRRRSPPAT